VLRRFFRDELTAPARLAPEAHAIPLPRMPLAVLGVTLVGFALSSPLGFGPMWPAAAGAVALLGPQLRRGAVTPRALVRAVDLPLLAFVLGLGVIVRAVSDHGLGDVVDSLLPSADGLPELLAATAIAAITANLLNNVPMEWARTFL
jgi:arsenical pump membrane protein